jgi:hypothetical protein
LGGALYFFYLAAEVVAGVGDGCYAYRGALPGYRFVQFSDRYVEALAELVFERTDYLAAVF